MADEKTKEPKENKDLISIVDFCDLKGLDQLNALSLKKKFGMKDLKSMKDWTKEVSAIINLK